ncbi:MAG TPA: IS110 family transposase [Acidimicrobiales bacterium]|nr:IS110 family transposase [Acidimicrobiales bacterium]
MEVTHQRCAGIDISKSDAKVCIRVQGRGRRPTQQTVTTWGATTREILALRDDLVAQRVSLVVIEATGDYWKPFYYVFEDAEFETLLANPRRVRAIPGRKSDVCDAAWLADLGAHGLVSGSLVPPEPIRQLRDLTRTRTAVTRERAREYQRLEKLLEDAGIKLSSVASSLTLVSVRQMLDALVEGERDPDVLAGLAHGQLRNKRAQLAEALVGRFSEHHAFMTQVHLKLIDEHTSAIEALTERIEVVIEPFRDFRTLICTIPGINTLVADVIIAETGADMSRFPTPQHLTSWAGTAPGINESAGKSKSTTTRPGSAHLKGALGVAAASAARSKATFLSAKFTRIAKRRGYQRALVAIERTMLITIWHMSTTGELYHDPGADYYRTRHPDRTKRHAIAQLQALGYYVTLRPAS